MSPTPTIHCDVEFNASTGIDRLEALRSRLAATFDDGADAADAIARVAAAARTLHDVDPSGLDAAAMRAWLEGVEQARRTVEAAAVAAAGAIDRSNPFRGQGFFTARAAVKHMCRLSGPEAQRRVQTARLHAGMPAWAGAQAAGQVGVAQSELMARVVANPRLPVDAVQHDAPVLLDDAIDLPYDEFERRVRTWEALADPDGDRTRNDRQHENRDVHLRPRPEGGWTLTGNLAELPGCEFAEIFAWFCEAEWRADWADARKRLGAATTTGDLQRTEPQRRADALLAMAHAAASTPPGAHSPRPTVYVLIDLGRRSRLFRGNSREAVMLPLTTCIWIGCDRPIAWCDADHSLGWKAHGATVPRNGGGLCSGHHHLKDRGFRVHRDDHGVWHVIDRDGNEVA